MTNVWWCAVRPLDRLARQAGNGDRRALEALVEGGYEQVWRLCATIVGGQRADDCAQETFIRAVGALARFRGESSALTWLLAIARHVCLDELRSSARRQERDTALRSAREPTVADPGALVALVDLVGSLDVDRRTAFVLTQVLGLSYDEAARVCECPVGTIRSRVARARADLVAIVRRSERDYSPGRSSLA
ncbi:MAG: sigma-70 family RNA polymerase sigma factor [Acidimicrobiales bacterium]